MKDADMPLTSIIILGTSEETSAVFEILANASAKVSVYTASAGVSLEGWSCAVYEKTSGAPNFVGHLSQYNRQVLLNGPGEFTVKRPAMPIAVGVCLAT